MIKKSSRKLENLAKPMDLLAHGKAEEFCEFIYDCVRRNNKLCFKGYSAHCRIRKFYTKFGIDYRNKPLFIGSKK